MCGITGYYSPERKILTQDLRRMSEVLSHRGPDADGMYSDDTVGLAHRRLSIIDLSHAADQPMLSHCKRYIIVFNGEIYNFRELSLMLGEKLNTTSDTEVVLQAFVKWGTNFVSGLFGMFAFVIYDTFKKEFFLFRDRTGIKPLYYYWDGNSFAFASELKSLTTINFIKKQLEIDTGAVNEYLYRGYIPEPKSIYKNIFKFPSGHFGHLSKNFFEINKYWNAKEKISDQLISNEEEAKRKLKEELIYSVKSHMICDVPFGTFLSGGIDSSLVTSMAQSLSTERIKTFSIGLNDSKHDESKYAREISELLGTEHYEYILTEKDAQLLIPSLTDIYDEPFADSSAIPTLLVSKMAKKEVKMVLSGDGGDELFMGYGAYQWAERLNSPLIHSFRKPISFGLSFLSNKCKRIAHLFDYSDMSMLKSHIFSQEQYLFSERETNLFLNPEYRRVLKRDENFNSLKRKLTPSEQQALFDLELYLKDDLLVKVDRASMHFGLEVRVPLLDYSVIEMSLNIDPLLKYKNGTTKYILKQILYDYVPSGFFDRPKKGFSIPLQKWLSNELKYLSDDYLSDDMIMKTGMLNLSEVRKLKDLYYNKKYHFLYNRLWLLISLQKFLTQQP